MRTFGHLFQTMPNHITNIIKAPEAVLAALAELLTGRTNLFAQKPVGSGLGINSETLDFLRASNALEAIKSGGITKLSDEDIGNNLGRRLYQFGKATDLDVADPVDFALTLTGSDRERYRKDPVSEKWEYHDEDEG